MGCTWRRAEEPHATQTSPRGWSFPSTRKGRPHCPPLRLCAWAGRVSTKWRTAKHRTSPVEHGTRGNLNCPPPRLCAWAGRVSMVSPSVPASGPLGYCAPNCVTSDTFIRRGAGAAYLAITRVHTMPLSSKTIVRVAAQTAHPLTVTPLRAVAAIVRLDRAGVNGAQWGRQTDRSGLTGIHVHRHQPLVQSSTGTGHSLTACSIG